jgi:cell cycle sensor histidine kinase DivJ
VAVTRDITPRRWHALAMRQAREEAESASRAKSAFIATISHELRTPLNAIIGFSEMLHRDLRTQDGNARHAEYSRIVRESGEHLMSLVNDLLDVSKIEAGRLSICVEPFPARDVVASSVDTLRPALAAKSIVLDVSISDDLVEMTADRRACKQMLMNLLSNACKFTPSGGRIELLAVIEGENAVLSVRDNGIGIAKDHVARLGEPFYQIDSTYTRQLEGAGLGLAIVRGLAELHGGRLEVESALGEGSCFRLVLPLDAEASDPVAVVTPNVPDVGEIPAPTPRVALVA